MKMRSCLQAVLIGAAALLANAGLVKSAQLVVPTRWLTTMSAMAFTP